MAQVNSFEKLRDMVIERYQKMRDKQLELQLQREHEEKLRQAEVLKQQMIQMAMNSFKHDLGSLIHLTAKRVSALDP